LFLKLFYQCNYHDCIFVLGARQKMQMFEETVEEDFRRLTELEDLSRWQPIQQIPTKHIQREADQTKVISRYRPLVATRHAPPVSVTAALSMVQPPSRCL